MAVSSVRDYEINSLSFLRPAESALLGFEFGDRYNAHTLFNAYGLITVKGLIGHIIVKHKICSYIQYDRF